MEREKHEQKLGVYQSRWVECVEERIEDIRRAFEEMTDRLSTRLNITEYQLHTDDRSIAVLRGKRARHAGDNEILVSIDPTPTQFNFVTKPRGDFPLQRSLVAYTDKGELMDCASLIAANRVLMFTRNARMETIQRVFAIYAPLEDGTAADAFERQRHVFERVVRYPDIAPVPATADPLGFFIASEDDPVSDGGNGYLREQQDMG